MNKFKVGDMTLRQRIKALNNGWDKDADEILQEMTGKENRYYINVPTHDNSYIDIRVDGAEANHIKEKFYYADQRSKMTAFKDALLWLLDKSGLEGYKKGDIIYIEADGKTYKVKIL